MSDHEDDEDEDGEISQEEYVGEIVEEIIERRRLVKIALAQQAKERGFPTGDETDDDAIRHLVETSFLVEARDVAAANGESMETFLTTFQHAVEEAVRAQAQGPKKPFSLVTPPKKPT